MVGRSKDYPVISYDMSKAGYGKTKVCCSTCVYDCIIRLDNGDIILCKHKDAEKKGFSDNGIDSCWSERKYSKK
jgi:hypothetical protein